MFMQIKRYLQIYKIIVVKRKVDPSLTIDRGRENKLVSKYQLRIENIRMS